MSKKRPSFSDPALSKQIKRNEICGNALLGAMIKGLPAEEYWLIEARARRLSALFAHYGISPDHEESWLLLASALAEDFVPGFQVEKKRGRKPSTDVWAGLVPAVTELMARRAMSANSACKILARTQPFRGPKGRKASTLLRRYQEQTTTRRVAAANALYRATRK